MPPQLWLALAAPHSQGKPEGLELINSFFMQREEDGETHLQDVCYVSEMVHIQSLDPQSILLGWYGVPSYR